MESKEIQEYRNNLKWCVLIIIVLLLLLEYFYFSNWDTKEKNSKLNKAVRELKIELQKEKAENSRLKLEKKELEKVIIQSLKKSNQKK